MITKSHNEVKIGSRTDTQIEPDNPPDNGESRNRNNRIQKDLKTETFYD